MGHIESCMSREQPVSQQRKPAAHPQQFGDEEEGLSEETRLLNERFLQGQSRFGPPEVEMVRPGFEMEVLYRGNRWVKALVRDSKADSFKVHFIGHNVLYDEWIPWAELRRRARIPRLQEVGTRSASSSVSGPSFQLSQRKMRQYMDMERQTSADLMDFFKTCENLSVVKCIICMDDVTGEGRAKLRCKHVICKTCLRNYISHAMGDISQFPLRCPDPKCSALISYAQAHEVLTQSELETFERRTAQVAIQSAGINSLIYCPFQDCGAPLELGEDDLSRSTVYCVECRRVFRRVDDRHQGEDVSLLENLAKKEGFQRCPECNLFIEKSEGCHHMTHTAEMGCKAGRTDFCYLCRTKLGGEFYQYELDQPGILHFQSSLGVFGPCRKVS